MKNEMPKKSPLINPADLVKLMKQESIILIDARTGPDARQNYNNEHLEGARYVDLEKDLSQKSANPSLGGRHPLPDIKNFAALLGRLGIEKPSHVVVYDDKAGANAASRFWWLLKAMGHENIQVLDGGLKNAVEAGVPVTNVIPNIKALPAYPADKWVLPTVNADKVAIAVADPGYLVIDVREAYRYRGESEPIDLVAGHIPGAVNDPYTGNLDADGYFLSAGDLADKYKEVIGDRDPRQVIVHCGSGVTACHTLLAMSQAGIEMPKLYVGSWSEWSRNDRPVATGE
ncbi:MAG: sulfurtransferase [Chitinophagaceae bacterium]